MGRIVARAMKPPPRSENDYEADAVAARRAWAGVAMPHLSGEPVPPSEARGNVEGFIGYAQIPVGVAGPLVLRGDATGEYRVPFATTEGAMVAGHQRGMKVCAEAGGIAVHVLHDALAVWPTFLYASAGEAIAAARALDRPALIAAAEGTTRHGRVTRLEPHVMGRRLVVELEMQTGEAHGINMVTRAAEAVAARIPGARQVLLHGFDVEKRASAWKPRGKHVIAEARIPRALCEGRLRARAADIAAAWDTYLLSFARMGTRLAAIQTANGLAAIYAACGQDIAYVAESAVGTLSLEDEDGDLVAVLDLPNLHAATVGGGTQKGTAAECIAITGARNARELACVIAGALLCGDLSLAASFVSGDQVEAHERLGRNRPG
jgi:hydroxymethylglutaryl-CoA reductase (NADPH)